MYRIGSIAKVDRGPLSRRRRQNKIHHRLQEVNQPKQPDEETAAHLRLREQLEARAFEPTLRPTGRSLLNRDQIARQTGGRAILHQLESNTDATQDTSNKLYPLIALKKVKDLLKVKMSQIWSSISLLSYTYEDLFRLKPGRNMRVSL